MKRGKYEATVADLKRKSPLLADYKFTLSIFAVGHGGTVPQCTVDAINDILIPAVAAILLMRGITTHISKHNANIAYARFGGSF
jgi:hypothetical protein